MLARGASAVRLTEDHKPNLEHEKCALSALAGPRSRYLHSRHLNAACTKRGLQCAPASAIVLAGITALLHSSTLDVAQHLLSSAVQPLTLRDLWAATHPYMLSACCCRALPAKLQSCSTAVHCDEQLSSILSQAW